MPGELALRNAALVPRPGVVGWLCWGWWIMMSRVTPDRTRPNLKPGMINHSKCNASRTVRELQYLDEADLSDDDYTAKVEQILHRASKRSNVEFSPTNRADSPSKKKTTASPSRKKKVTERKLAKPWKGKKQTFK